MPKVDFTNKIDEFEIWLVANATPDTYNVYACDDGELVMRPRKSTPTYDYATVTFHTTEAIEKIVMKLTVRGYLVFKPRKLIWDIEKLDNYKS